LKKREGFEIDSRASLIYKHTYVSRVRKQKQLRNKNVFIYVLLCGMELGEPV